MRSAPTSRLRLILCDFGKNGTAYVETDPVKTEACVVADLLSGEHDNPIEVVTFSVAEGWARNVRRHSACRRVSGADRGPEAPEGHPQLRIEAPRRTAGPELIW